MATTCLHFARRQHSCSVGIAQTRGLCQPRLGPRLRRHEVTSDTLCEFTTIVKHHIGVCCACFACGVMIVEHRCCVLSPINICSSTSTPSSTFPISFMTCSSMLATGTFSSVSATAGAVLFRHTRTHTHTIFCPVSTHNLPHTVAIA